MVQFTKAAMVITIAILPVLSAPVPPRFGGFKVGKLSQGRYQRLRPQSSQASSQALVRPSGPQVTPPAPYVTPPAPQVTPLAPQVIPPGPEVPPPGPQSRWDRFSNGLERFSNHPAMPMVLLAGTTAMGMMATPSTPVPSDPTQQYQYARDVQDELDARAYDLQLHLRENGNSLSVRDLSESIEARDNTGRLASREFADPFEREVRRDLETRQLAEPLINALD